MDSANSSYPPRPPIGSSPPPPPGPDAWKKAKKILVALGIVLLLLGKWAGKLKFLVAPLLKFFPMVLKTGGSMFVTIWIYAVAWGWMFAVGFVLLIFVHECGHLVAAKRLGLKVGAPVFIPFMGAFIALKDAPKNAWIESQVGIGGPLLGTVGAVACYGIYLLTGNPMYRALTYTGFFLNLFNLAPVGFLDGGRIATALSPWLWVVGIVIIGYLLGAEMMAGHFNFLLFLIFLMSLPRVFSLFRRRTEAEQRYFEVTPAQRWVMAGLYFGLLAFLVVGMKLVEFRVR